MSSSNLLDSMKTGNKKMTEIEAILVAPSLFLHFSRHSAPLPMDFIKNASAANAAAKKNEGKDYMPATKCVLEGKQA